MPSQPLNKIEFRVDQSTDTITLSVIEERGIVMPKPITITMPIPLFLKTAYQVAPVHLDGLYKTIGTQVGIR